MVDPLRRRHYASVPAKSGIVIGDTIRIVANISYRSSVTRYSDAIAIQLVQTDRHEYGRLVWIGSTNYTNNITLVTYCSEKYPISPLIRNYIALQDFNNVVLIIQ